MSGIPILVEAHGVHVLVVGGGVVATRKARALCAAGATVRVVAPEICPALTELAGAGRLTIVRRRYEAGDIADAELVIAATDDRETNAAVAADARAAHRLVNVADAAQEGSFSTMATHRAGALVVGVSTGVPAAATRIRDDIAERFDDRYARALDELSALRDTMLAAGQAGRWRAVSAELMGPGFCESVDAGTFRERVRPWR